MSKYLVFWYDGNSNRATVVHDDEAWPRMPFVHSDSPWLSEQLATTDSVLVNGVVGPLPEDCSNMMIVVDNVVVPEDGFVQGEL